MTAKDGPSIGLDEFDSIEVSVLPGQDFLHAGDLVFQRDGKEVFRLSGVSRPEGFRQVCLKARNALGPRAAGLRAASGRCRTLGVIRRQGVNVAAYGSDVVRPTA